MRIQRDVPVPLRDGARIYADIFRPADETPVPALLAWGPYGKHEGTLQYLVRAFPAAGLKEGDVGPYAMFEGPDPHFWVPRGYAIVNVDPRGLWHSEGNATFVSPEEAEDCYDVIEWIARQPWCSGKVGMTGVSYLAVIQWRVAALQPPHLAAINPWEGWSDTYREVAYHGGMPETWFWPYWAAQRIAVSSTQIEDLLAEWLEHPLWDEFWQSKAAELERITVPAYVVASWSDHGLHTRGTLEGFKRIRSSEKWLEIHGHKKWAYYYDPQSLQRQAAFFDHYLKGSETEVMSWPRVRAFVRVRGSEGEWRAFDGWPAPQTRYQRLYLDPASGRLLDELPAEPSSRWYLATSGGYDRQRRDPLRPERGWTGGARLVAGIPPGAGPGTLDRGAAGTHAPARAEAAARRGRAAGDRDLAVRDAVRGRGTPATDHPGSRHPGVPAQPGLLPARGDGEPWPARGVRWGAVRLLPRPAHRRLSCQRRALQEPLAVQPRDRFMPQPDAPVAGRLPCP